MEQLHNTCTLIAISADIKNYRFEGGSGTSPPEETIFEQQGTEQLQASF